MTSPRKFIEKHFSKIQALELDETFEFFDEQDNHFVIKNVNYSSKTQPNLSEESPAFTYGYFGSDVKFFQVWKRENSGKNWDKLKSLLLEYLEYDGKTSLRLNF